MEQRQKTDCNTLIKMQFDPAVAKDVGTDSAIILSNIQYWTARNRANEKHLYDGRYWTYNSIKAFTELFSYLTERQIRTCLDKLVEKGYLVTGEYNKSKYDRTKWYSSQLDLSEMSTQADQNDQPIPNSNTNRKLVTKVTTVQPTADTEVVYEPIDEFDIKPKKTKNRNTHGNPEVQGIIDLFENKLGMSLPDGQKERRYAKLLVTKFGYAQARAMVSLVLDNQKDKYFAYVATPKDLWYKLPKIKNYIDNFNSRNNQIEGTIKI